MADAKIRVTADTAQAQTAIQNLNKSLGSIERSGQQAERSLGGLGDTARMAGAAFAALGAGIGVAEIVDITGRFTDLNSRLINATGSSQNAAEALDGISASARTTFSSLETTADVFLKNSIALNELGYTTNEQIQISSALNNAMAVSGARGQQAASALDAFSKAVAGGKMQGEDLNRIIDNAPELFKSLSDGLGVTTEEFRKMVREGEITSDVMIPALLSQFDKLEQKASDMPATIGDAFVQINNELFKFIGQTDKALGISAALSAGLLVVADNIELLVGAMAGLAVAAGALMIPLLPAVAAMAVLAAKVAAIMALGAGIAYVAKEMGLFAKATEDQSNAETERLKRQSQANENAIALEARRLAAIQKVIDTQNEGIAPMMQKLQLERESIGLNQTELAIKRNLAEAARTLKVDQDKISQSVRDRIVKETQSLETARQRASIDKIIQGLQTEQLGLAQADKQQREIVLAIRSQELEFGRALNAEERNKLTTTIQTTQAMREQVAIKEAITDATRQQTELEKIQRGLSLQRTLGGGLTGGVTAESEFKRDLEALDAYHKVRNSSEAEALRQREELTRAYNQRVLGLEMDRIQQTMMAETNGLNTIMSARDQATVQAVGQQERQREIVRGRIEFEKKSEMQKAQFGIEQGAQMFSALGAQNKKAFEAAKAFNIANAIMNTFMGATKALATYPPPFNFIAAAATVAMGMAQVAQIRSQQYSGRELGGPIAAGMPYLVGEGGPEIIRAPSGGGMVIPNDQIGGGMGGGSTNINFTINAVDTTGFDELLIERRGVITSIIQDAMLEKGQRF